MQKLPPAVWAAARADYVTGARTLPEIIARYGMLPETLYSRKSREKWELLSGLRAGCRRRPQRICLRQDSRALTLRILGLLSRTVSEIELHMIASGIRPPIDRARDLRTLATIARLSERIAKLCDQAPESAPLTAKITDLEKPDDDLLIKEISKRLGRLQRGPKGPDAAPISTTPSETPERPLVVHRPGGPVAP